MPQERTKITTNWRLTILYTTPANSEGNHDYEVEKARDQLEKEAGGGAKGLQLVSS